MVLRGEKLGKRFGERLVLRDVSFEAASGTVLGIVGRNGAGKSTLLRIVSGLVAPSRGRILWNDAPTRGFCALSAPDAPLYRELTCLENLHLFAGGDKSLLQDHLDKFSLGKRAHDYAGDLSSGLRARLGLCLADYFARNAHPILLLDEPTANLDEAGRSLVENLVREHKPRGVTLIATNDPRDLGLCDSIFEIPSL